MHARTAVPAHRRVSAAWAVPVTLGLLFGAYAAYLFYDNGASPAAAVVLGVVACVVATAVCYLVGREQSHMIREVRAATYGALFGIAIGVLRSLTNSSLLTATIFGLGFGLLMAAVSFYFFYTRED